MNSAFLNYKGLHATSGWAFLLLFFSSIEVVNADVLQINATVSSRQVERGLNLSDGQAVAALGFDWSAQQGQFAGLQCYQSHADDHESLPRGCQAYLGYFMPLKGAQALTFNLAHNDYARTRANRWNYTTAAIDWHVLRNATLSLGAVDDWLGRGSAVLFLDGSARYALTPEWSVNGRIGLMQFESSAALDSSELLELGLQYDRQRWSANLQASLTDREVQSITPFAAQRAQITLSVSYRLY